jgi:hypothetical protein
VTVLADDSIVVVRGDTLPSLIAQIVGDDSIPLDLTGCTVWFNARPLAGERTDGWSGACIIVRAVDGIFAFDWGPGDTITPGVYAAEAEVIFPSGRRLTVPTGHRLRMTIPDDVNDAV